MKSQSDRRYDSSSSGHRGLGRKHISVEHESLQGARVLLVEDNIINQEVAFEMLSQEGILVEIAENGQQAIDMLYQKNYDCVLMDIQMPVMDGIEATRKIRTDKRFSKLPILAMTAHALTKDVQRSLDAGMNYHISKPINAFELFREIAYWIEPIETRQEHITVEEAVSHDQETLNLQESLQKIGGDRELFVKVLSTFLEQHAQDYQRVVQLVQQKDMDATRKAIHSLKGVALIVGANELYKHVMEIEGVLNEGSGGDIASYLPEFKNKLEEAMQAIEGFIASSGKERLNR